MRNYIPVDVDNMPDIFEIPLVGEVYTFRIDYNEVADFYTVTIWHDQKETPIAGASFIRSISWY